ncbi:phosphate ABC transporter permease subunit PstC [Celeribacter ethanolicus]|uniref:Phosphate transport system permease protein n=1 Tax=Celeribacter ethanolicus TaxID=1758178 RepID=A0A291G9H9_9RHOB|nr:phosphate ABC transporter permease subunit PstC [Celeribacter ethanolicus]ATG46724.1 phosphate ABC transporter permease subunit PstC [Celeribacter ethanolicus]TNE66268.1 MAG: phosphate ABC transporter permease subunit PstC [Paracoccaceae bacterium]
MPVLWLFILVLALGLIGFVLGRARALKDAQGDIRLLHSLPSYYGSNVLLATLIPGFAVLVLWLIVQPMVIHGQVAGMIPERGLTDYGSLNLAMSDVRRVADGLDIAVEQGALSAEQARDIRTEFTDIRGRLGEVGVALGSNVQPYVLQAAQTYRTMNATGHWLMTGAVLAAAIAGFAVAFLRTGKDLRARNSVERVILMLLLSAASIAILTTVGIVLSLIFNTIEFFKLYPATDFFFGTTWAPSFGGGSELGILPLFWGTFYVSLIALVVAVPIGLFAAVYLSEYAGPKVRAIAKPLLEVLAGIPTIVYGLFALLTVGPLLMSVFGDGGLGWMQGGRSVMTAGLVMGVMLIPFVSSLSDDIINAVPQAMRDGSLGLGATKSETVKQVVLPAALPGIVGAILLAASRAIGETMIVVLGAGAAAKLNMNPFEAMTTVTTRIVSQLTGDADFSSPEALVAFALGMTLFVITLGLNIVALVIVRKYREQYD